MNSSDIYHSILIFLVVVVIIILLFKCSANKEANYGINDIDPTQINIDGNDCYGDYDSCTTYWDSICQNCLLDYGRETSCAQECAMRNSCRDDLETCKTSRESLVNFFNSAATPYPLEGLSSGVG